MKCKIERTALQGESGLKQRQREQRELKQWARGRCSAAAVCALA